MGLRTSREQEDMAKAEPKPHRLGVAEVTSTWNQIVTATSRSVLGNRRIELDQSFPELGGTSIDVLRMTARLTDRAGFENPQWARDIRGQLAKALFDGRPLGELAAIMATLPAPPTAPAKAPAEPYESLASSQRAIWMHQRLIGDTPAYNIANLVKIRGEVSPPRICRALDALVARHPGLRTSFIDRDGELVASVAEPCRAGFESGDIRHLSEDDRERAADECFRAVARAAFDLAKPPLLRASLLRISADDWRLLLVVHHIVADGWSMAILYRDLSALYMARSAKTMDALPDIAAINPSRLISSAESLSAETAATAERYWCNKLVGLDSTATLRAGRGRSGLPSHSGVRIRRAVDAALTDAVAGAGKAMGTTTFAVMLTALKIAVARLTGNWDVCIGSVFAHRPTAASEDMIGPFVRLVPLRTDLSSSDTVASAVAAVTETVREAFDHFDCPTDVVLAAARRWRPHDVHPLFDVLFVYQNQPPCRLHLDRAECDIEVFDTGSAKFGLSIEVSPASDGLCVEMELDRAVYDVPYADAIFDAFRAALLALVGDAEADPRRMSLVPDGDLPRWLAFLNPVADDMAGTAPQDDCRIEESFRSAAIEHDDKIAVLDGETTLTFAALSDRVAGMAAGLRARGVGAGDRVAVGLPRGSEAISAMLAIFACGAIYVPIDWRAPAKRIAAILRDASARCLIGNPACFPISDLAPIDPAALVATDGVDPEILAPETMGAEDMAAIIYTSGSTADPKPVALSHGQLLRRVAWAARAYPFASGEVCCHRTPLSFVDHLAEILTPVLHGCPLAIVPDVVAADSEALAALMERHKVTRLTVVPTLLRALIAEPDTVRQRLASLRLCTSSGEALPSELARRFLDVLPGATLLNVYGSAEVAADAMCQEVDRSCLEGSTVPLGHPIAGARLYILNEQLAPVPPGGIGEIFIGGAVVSEGYRGRHDLTAERFFADPFSGRPGARMYRSGDLARLNPDGHVEYLGRCDREFNMHGIRIDPAEIEAAVRSLVGVDECAVAVRETADGRPVLVCYIACHEAAIPGSADFAGKLRRVLPEYMVPRVFVPVPELPTGSTGKLDYERLPAPSSQAHSESVLDHEDDYIREVAAIWCRRLNAEIPMAESDFFALGGDSLLANRMLNDVSEIFGVTIRFHEFFAQPTILGLATLVAESHLASIDGEQRSALFGGGT